MEVATGPYMTVEETIKLLDRLIAQADPAMKRRYQIEQLAYLAVYRGATLPDLGLLAGPLEQQWYEQAKTEATLKSLLQGGPDHA